jgi:integrase
MARAVKRLTAKAVASKTKPGYYNDGAGLYLQVAKGGSKSWIFRYMLDGRAREMGLGSLLAVSLDNARKKAAACRASLDADKDPIEERQEVKRARQLADARALTFDQCAEGYIKAHRAGWKNEKHASQWENTLKTYASPVFGKLPVQDVDEALVMKVLEKIWETKTETATRVRNRIELVLDWAKARKYRTGENPARWRGHLDKLLPKRSKVQPPKPHAALPYTEIGKFMAELRRHSGVAARTLEFVILTAARVNEAVNATWPEVDLKTAVWVVPAGRMKASREHRVPLSGPATTLLEAMKAKHEGGNFIFPGWKIERPVTDAACRKLIRDMGYEHLTIHGFRSTFRDWAAEQTAYPREVAESALAHTISDKTEAAYRRGDLFEKRAKMMTDWARYCATIRTSEVTPLRGRKKRA